MDGTLKWVTANRGIARLIVLAALVIATGLVGACGSARAQDAPSGQPAVIIGDPLPPAQNGGAYKGGTATGDTAEGARFAQWALDQDPERRYITDAVVRNNRTLGVKVNPNVTKNDVQALLVALAQGMARTFPGQAVTVDAFYQAGPKLAEAQFNPQTNRVDIQWAQ
ncbi:MAG: hypothetical protein U0641_02335 [Anaerolineae bacterium]